MKDKKKKGLYGKLVAFAFKPVRTVGKEIKDTVKDIMEDEKEDSEETT